LTSKPDGLERLTAWTLQRQRLESPAASPLEALESTIAVYSTHPSAPLTLLARAQDLAPSEFQALERQRQAVRIVAMRGSAFMVPTGTAGAIFSAAGLSEGKLESTLRSRGLDLETYRRLAPRVLECCTTPLTPAMLKACLPLPEDVYMVARVLARQGQILRVNDGSLRTDTLKYVATVAWLGQPFEALDRAEALAWLAREYLRAFGPIRHADFAWWSGCTRREAAAALSQPETVERDGLILHAEDAGPFDHVEPPDLEHVDILPKWDALTMGYAPDGRQRFIDDRFLSLAYTSVTGSPGATSGDGLPLILRGGRAIASWSHRFAGQHLEVSVTPFEDTRKAPTGEAAFEGVAKLLGARSLKVTVLSRAPVQ
jgi:hypothetical protein